MQASRDPAPSGHRKELPVHLFRLSSRSVPVACAFATLLALLGAAVTLAGDGRGPFP